MCSDKEVRYETLQRKTFKDLNPTGFNVVTPSGTTNIHKIFLFCPVVLSILRVTVATASVMRAFIR
jgi:hypothetical protein